MTREHEESREPESEEFGELLRFTLAGFVGGLAAAVVLDRAGLSRSGLGQWLVRTLSGEGESLLEGVYALRKRIAGRASSLAEAYGWGKLFGMVLPWIVDGASRLAGVDVYGVESFYVPFFYSMSDQVGAGVSGFAFFKRRERGWAASASAFLRHPVMLTGLLVVLAVPMGLFLARALGFSPTTQVRTALETIAANLCWLPPLVGWLAERRSGRLRGSS